MRRNAIIGLLALAAMLTAKQIATAKSARDADFDANGIVDFGDFILFAEAFGSDQSGFDLDGNGAVDFPDFILFAKQFGEGAPEESITISASRRCKAGDGLDPAWQVPDGIARF